MPPLGLAVKLKVEPTQIGALLVTEGAVGVVIDATFTVKVIAGQLEAVSCMNTVCVPTPAATVDVKAPTGCQV